MEGRRCDKRRSLKVFLGAILVTIIFIGIGFGSYPFARAVIDPEVTKDLSPLVVWGIGILLMVFVTGITILLGFIMFWMIKSMFKSLFNYVYPKIDDEVRFVEVPQVDT